MLHKFCTVLRSKNFHMGVNNARPTSSNNTTEAIPSNNETEENTSDNATEAIPSDNATETIPSDSATKAIPSDNAAETIPNGNAIEAILNVNATDVDYEPISQVPPMADLEDYEVRFNVDMIDQTIQPLNVCGLKESDNAKLMIYLMPETTADPEQKLEKVYEAPAHEPADPLSYEDGREYLVCVKVAKGAVIGLVSARIQDQNVHTTEFATLPYWVMKWLERRPRY